MLPKSAFPSSNVASPQITPVPNAQLSLPLFQRSTRLHLSYPQTYKGIFSLLDHPLVHRIITDFPRCYHRNVSFLFPLSLSGIATGLAWISFCLLTSFVLSRRLFLQPISVDSSLRLSTSTSIFLFSKVHLVSFAEQARAPPDGATEQLPVISFL